MKPIRLHKVLSAIGVSTNQYPNTLIKHVSDRLDRFGERTVIFHLRKTVELDVRRFKALRSTYIVTDQPFLKKQQLPIERLIFVPNVEQAYLEFIRFYRSQFNIPVVAVTGTVGKTTTKEMIKQALSKEFNVVGTIRSKNNLRHNHRYLMSIDDTTDVAVFETAMTHAGNLIIESEFFRPTIGVMTTIGFDHLNQLKTMDHYTRAKGEMLAALNYEGTLILNNDDERIRMIDLSPFKGKIVTFGIKEKAEFQATDITFEENGMRFTLVYKDKAYPTYIPGLGVHQVSNALAALAALNELGMDLKKAIGYLSLFEPIRSHTALLKGINGSMIIDDTWSSNPTSLKSALAVLTEKGKDKVKIAVIGRINYLGDHEQRVYEQIGKMIVDHEVDYVIISDYAAKRIGESAIKHGLQPNRYLLLPNREELAGRLKRLLNSQAVVLMKVSMLDDSYRDILNEITEK